MKRRASLLPLLLLVSSVPLLTNCSSASRKQTPPSSSAAVGENKPHDKPVKVEDHDVDEYSATSVADPLEPLNRATFWLNDGIYTVVLR
ncbi:MAG: hypothetical protein WBX20_16795, partial [Terrimicrobiaceae bacterium]